MLTGNPGHLKAFDYAGPYRYSLTFCTDCRQRVFVTRERIDLVLMQIERSAAEEQFAVIAYCFMPDHLHLLVEGRSEASDCRRFINRAKQFLGFHYAKAFGHRLWQRYGFERVLRNDEATLVVARYILENPLRAGLVRRVEDYPFAGSRVCSLAEILEAVSIGNDGPAEAGHYA
ncbi:MAG: transposase [Phycisphaerales bacterium]|nr:transposase [Phycisphaerales bacterium]